MDTKIPQFSENFSPVFIEKGKGAFVTDYENNSLIDTIMGVGPIILGYKNISQNSENFLQYEKLANDEIKDSINDSYDFFINSKYKVKINEKTLERVKNYFR